MGDAPSVSDHALVRYIERVRGESLDAYRAEIVEMIEANRDGDVPDGSFDDGFVFVLEGDKVVTVLPPAFRPKKNKRCRWQSLVHVPRPTQEPGDE